jgi:hypothetical protein
MDKLCTISDKLSAVQLLILLFLQLILAFTTVFDNWGVG